MKESNILWFWLDSDYTTNFHKLEGKEGLENNQKLFSVTTEMSCFKEKFQFYLFSFQKWRLCAHYESSRLWSPGNPPSPLENWHLCQNSISHSLSLPMLEYGTVFWLLYCSSSVNYKPTLNRQSPGSSSVYHGSQSCRHFKATIWCQNSPFRELQRLTYLAG